MLLLLMRGHSDDAPPPSVLRPVGKGRDYTGELLTAALFLSGWSLLRLLVARDTSRGVDAALAVSCFLIGAGTVAHCLRALRAGQRKACAERTRARVANRELRANRRRSRSKRSG